MRCGPAFSRKRFAGSTRPRADGIARPSRKGGGCAVCKYAARSEAFFENLPRYAGLPPSEFATVLHARRAPLLPYLPPRVFCQLNRARERFPAVDALRTLVSRLTDQT